MPHSQLTATLVPWWTPQCTEPQDIDALANRRKAMVSHDHSPRQAVGVWQVPRCIAAPLPCVSA